MTSASDDEIRPILGRMRAPDGKAQNRYLSCVYAAMRTARPGFFKERARKPSGFTGALRGRGAGVAAALALRPHAGFAPRRVAVIARVALGGRARVRAHLNYLAREGTDELGAAAQLYGPDARAPEREALLERLGEDRHQFRIILSPEDASEFEDLSSYARKVMAIAETDLRAELYWVAADHYNTDHPHTHILLSGRQRRESLIIAPSYLSDGLRKRAEEIATRELGPREETDIAPGRGEAEKEGLTGTDRVILAMARDQAVIIDEDRRAFGRLRRKLLLKRLRALESMGLARRGPGAWKISGGLEATLEAIGERADFVREMREALGDDLSVARLRDFDAADAGKIIGRVAGIIEGPHGRGALALEAADGNQWRVALGAARAMAPLGAIVEARREPGTADAVLHVLSWVGLDELAASRGPTVLDDVLERKRAIDTVEYGFGAEFARTLEARKRWLLAEGLASEDDGKFLVRRGGLCEIHRAQLFERGASLAGDLGKPFAEGSPGDTVRGVYRFPVDTPSGRLAFFETAGAAMFLPWSAALEKRRGLETTSVISADIFLRGPARAREGRER